MSDENIKQAIRKALAESNNRTDISKAAIDVMTNNLDVQEDALVGSFCYDPEKEELFGVYSVYAEDVKFYNSSQWGKEVRTGTRLHKSIWDKEFRRGRDSRFRGDYTRVPRGRVFEFKDEGFIVFTGDWVDSYPEVKELILDEFQLSEENTEFRKDEHWDIGRGWSDEF